MKRFHLVLLSLSFCLTSAWGQTPEQRKATIAYLRGLQVGDGGFKAAQIIKSTAPQPNSSLRASEAVLRALKYFGGEPRNREACAAFVQACFDEASGGFVDHPGGRPDVATTAVGIMAVVELKLPVEDYRDRVVKYLGEKSKTFEDIRIAAAGLESIGKLPAQSAAWLEQIGQMRNEDGTYGKADGVARATGGAVVAVLRLGGKVEQRDNVIKALKAGQRVDGGFGKEGVPDSDLESCYRVVRAFVMLKEKPDAERCRAFVGKCRNADGGYGVQPGKPSNAAATYFASIILHWLADK